MIDCVSGILCVREAGKHRISGKFWEFPRNARVDPGGEEGGQGGHAPPPQDAEVAFWSTAIILIQW